MSSSTCSAPLLSALGLGLIVFGILKSGTWGVVQPKPEAPQWIGLSPVIWLLLGGGVALALFLRWESLRIGRGEGALLNPKLLRNVQMRSGVLSFLFMFLVQAGTFFVVPLFLSVALGLSAIETGVRLLPMSLTLLLFAAGVPKLAPDANPRRVVNAGFLLHLRGPGPAGQPARHRRRAGDHHRTAAAHRVGARARWPRSWAA